MRDNVLYEKVRSMLSVYTLRAFASLDWLAGSMHPYFFITMQDEVETIARLALSCHNLATQRRITLTDQEQKLIIACLDIPGSLYDSLKGAGDREVSYAEVTHSYAPLPDIERKLEVLRLEFNRKTHQQISTPGEVRISPKIRKAVFHEMKRLYPQFDFREFDQDLHLLWRNNERYVRISPPERIARILWVYQEGRKRNGLYFNVEKAKAIGDYGEFRLLFAVGNPPQRGFITQIMEVFQRLDIGVRRSYNLFVSTGMHWYFLGTFYVSPRDGKLLERGSSLFRILQTELYNTQILSPATHAYAHFVAGGVMTGAEASLINAFIAFCHTILAHSQPDRFSFDAVKNAIYGSPDITLKLTRAFQERFNPETQNRAERYQKALDAAKEAIESYNTGNEYLDDVRRTIFQSCLLFVSYTLKTNFFVPEKHALAFRLDPAFLGKMDAAIVSELLGETPFRITFFFGRYGVGYHIGFSDIARGGWRTVICHSNDEYVTNTNMLFREVFVLAHTQHLKNKDIYEGGSKMTVVLDAEGMDTEEAVTQRLFKLQYGFINAFFDIFVTENGRAKSAYVVDYYGEEEPIELGPDENMHDAMIELIAQQSVKCGYVLGIGAISSKDFGINHKEYGVTSRGVMKFAEIAARAIGIDMEKDSFTVKMTGGPKGDVAGNSLKLLLERCGQGRILSIADGAGALYDPEGVDREEIGRLILMSDVVDFDPHKLHKSAFILFRHQHRKEGLQLLHRKLIRTDAGIEEQWIMADEFHREFDALIFSVPADIFLPCGGRPETIGESNWRQFFNEDGTPTARIIVEGANSFITARAREEIQKRGVVILRDSSANKCGVIASSYEVIANLLMSEKEFHTHKDIYIRDVLAILGRRAEDEAKLIFKRYDENEGRLLYTEISVSISKEINAFYAKLFGFLQKRPELLEKKLFRKFFLNYFPAFVRQNPKYRDRVRKLPSKMKFAILASEIASTIVYQGGWDADFEVMLGGYLKRHAA